MSKAQFSLILFFLLIAINASVFARIQVIDDTNQTISLNKPAHNIISLSPGLTEIIDAAGGIALLKGVVSFSDYPEQATLIPQVGRFDSLDLEKILSLQPDLVIAWKSGNPQLQIEQLKKLGLNVYVSEIRDFKDISATIRRLGLLMGTQGIANPSADHFDTKLEQLKKHYSYRTEKKRKTFIQIWNNPVMTVNEKHLIARVVSLCGGDNIFSDSESLTYSPSMESILEKDPEVIIATGMEKTANDWLTRWQQWPFLQAVHKTIFSQSIRIIWSDIPQGYFLELKVSVRYLRIDPVFQAEFLSYVYQH